MYNMHNLLIFPKFCKVTVTKRASNSHIHRLAHFANLDKTPSTWELAGQTNSYNSFEQTFFWCVIANFLSMESEHKSVSNDLLGPFLSTNLCTESK